MKKSIAYLCLLFLFLLSLFSAANYYSEQQQIVLQKNSLQFVSVAPQFLPLEHRKTLAFVVSDSTTAERKLYRFSHKTSPEHKHFLCMTISDTSIPTSDLFVKAFDGSLVFPEQTCVFTTNELIAMTKAKGMTARRLLQHQRPANFWEFLDNSPLIFLVFGFVLFLVLWVMDACIYLLQMILTPSRARLLVQLFGLLLLGFGLLHTVPVWSPPSFNAKVIRLVLFFVPSFVSYEYLNARYFRQYSFPDSALARFLTIGIGATASLYLANQVGQWIDQQNFEVVVTTRNSLLELGFILSLCLGNLCHDIRKQLQWTRQQKQQLQYAQKAALGSRAELEALQASVNPHFLYNALNAIASLAQRDGEKTEKMALALSSFYQYITNKEQQQLSSLGEELQMLEHYLAIEKIRFEDKLQFESQHTAAALACQLPRFSLQPIIENAIKYGFRNDYIKVRLEAKVVQDELVIKIFDSGKAFDDQLSRGYGLQSVVKKLRYHYPARHQLAFVNESQKHVYLSIQQK